jgi:hypothetical protein
MFSTVTSFSCSASRSRSASFANSSVIGVAGEMRGGDHAPQRALEFAHVGADALGDEERDFLGQLDLRRRACLAHQDRDAGLELRRLDRDRQTPAEARLQPLLEAVDLLRIAIAGQDHLLLALEQRVEGMEELLLRALLAREELNVVDQQRIERAIRGLEIVDGVVLQRLDHVADEALAVHVGEPRVAGCAP